MPGAQHTSTHKRFRKLRVLISASTHWFSHLERTKVALLIGINYANVKGWKLKGSNRDVRGLEKLLIDKFDYNPKNVTVLIDEENTPDDMLPTMTNMRRELTSFVNNRPHCKNFFFAYAGHSYQREEDTSDPLNPPVEEDKKEEYIIPLDAFKDSDEPDSDTPSINEERIITDKELKRHLVDALPLDSFLFSIFDSCHSGTLLNLKHQRCNRTIGMKSLVFRMLKRVIKTGENIEEIVNDMAPPTVDTHTASLPLQNLRKIESHSSDAMDSIRAWSARGEVLGACSGFCSCRRRLNRRRAQAVSISACRDNQSDYEDRQKGALIQSIIRFLEKEQAPTYRSLMNAVTADFKTMHEEAKDKLAQRVAENHPHWNFKWMSCTFCHWHKECRLNPSLIDMAEHIQEPQLSSHHPIDTKQKIRI